MTCYASAPTGLPGTLAVSLRAETLRHNDESSLPFEPVALRGGPDPLALCQPGFRRPGSKLVQPRYQSRDRLSSARRCILQLRLSVFAFRHRWLPLVTESL